MRFIESTAMELPASPNKNEISLAQDIFKVIQGEALNSKSKENLKTLVFEIS